MATMTLLSMVQNILSAMESDDVNDISDTVEALQVAEIIKETYYDIVSGRDWPIFKMKTSLTGLADTSNPTKMQMPANTDKVYWIKYNKKDVTYMEPKEFQDMLDSREEQTGVIDSSGYILNQDPTYWTTFDDEYIFFDGYNSDDESTLQTSNSVVYILKSPSWTVSNSFIPTLPDKMFPLLLADAKGTCFLNLKQTSNAKEERKAQRLRVRMQKESNKTNDAETKTNKAVNYGRK